MARFRWLRTFFECGSTRKDRRRLAARGRKPVRLVLESLEDRITPSQTAGSYIELVKAVAVDTAPNTNYDIQITNSFTFDAGGQVTISKLGSGSTLTIEGQSGNNYTLTGNGNRLFDVVASQNVTQNVTLKNLTLTGGSGMANGGAILVTGGNVSLSGMTVKSNTVIGGIVPVTAAAFGGGIYVGVSSSLSLRNTLIANNTAGGPLFAEGGGVYASGASTITITDSTLSGNKAVGGGGATGTKAGESGGSGSFAFGGGLCVNGVLWTVTLEGDTLSANESIGGKGGNGAMGGNAATSEGNGGTGGAGGNAQGGGLYASGNGTLTILDDPAAPLTHPSLVMGNSTEGGSGGNGGNGGNGGTSGIGGTGGGGGVAGSADGGAFYVSTNAMVITANIGNTTFYGNAAFGAKGGSGGAGGSGLKPGASGFNQPDGDAQGGGLHLSLGGGSVTMVNSTVASNSAVGGGPA
jgi:hypothetical protein